MVRKMIESWFENERRALGDVHARDIGFDVSQLPADWQGAFRRKLEADPDARRLVEVLPGCNVPMLTGFIVLTVASGPQLEGALQQITRRRGRSLIRKLRERGRAASGPEKPELSKTLRRAERAFDTRRRGLIEYTYPLLVIRNYLRFRTGYAPTSRELSALLKAGLTAVGRPAFLQVIDYDLLHRNLRNFEKRHPDLSAAATGERCAQLIELYPPHDSAQY
jgi:hypothetical protein